MFRLLPHSMYKNPKISDLAVGEHCGIVALEHPLDQWEDAVAEEGGQVAPSAPIHVVIRERTVGSREVHLEGHRGVVSDKGGSRGWHAHVYTYACVDLCMEVWRCGGGGMQIILASFTFLCFLSAFGEW